MAASKKRLAVLEEETAAYDVQGNVAGIPITFAPDKSAFLPSTDLASQILLGDANLPTLLVGEENFTFAVALAAQRRSQWKNIYVSKFQDLHNAEVILPEFEDVRKRNMAQVVLNRTLMAEKDDAISEQASIRRLRALCPNLSNNLEENCKGYAIQASQNRVLANEHEEAVAAEEARLRKLSLLPCPSMLTASYKKTFKERRMAILQGDDEDDPSVEVDLDMLDNDSCPPSPVVSLLNDFESGGWLNLSIAEGNMPHFVLNAWTEMFPSVVVFHCPILSDGSDVATLVRDYFTSAGRQQKEGDYLFLGIIKRVPYVRECDLVTLLGHPIYCNGPLWFAQETAEDHSHIAQVGYRFIGADPDFPLRMLEHGYLHRGRYRIHELIIRDHLMLCFQHKAVKVSQSAAEEEPKTPIPSIQPPPSLDNQEQEFGSIFIQVKLHHVKSSPQKVVENVDN
uniref:Uncharacterized protein n=1 Tax=Plectus sambesii TaxID=2011161 RepID=A0A914W6U3_9BILA